MKDKDKKVVNTEEQNRAVNPADSANQEESISQDPVNIPSSGNNTTSETESPEKGSEVKRPHRIEGDDASGIERRIPNL